ARTDRRQYAGRSIDWASSRAPSRIRRALPLARADRGLRTSTRLPSLYLRSEKIEDVFGEQVRLLELRVMPGAIDKGKARPRNERRISATVGGAHDAAGGAPQPRLRRGDAAEPALEPRVVHVGLPAVEAERLPVARAPRERRIGKRIEVRCRTLRIVPACPAHHVRMAVE